MRTIQLWFLAVGVASAACISSVVHGRDDAEKRAVEFAERVVMIQLARAISPAVRAERIRCPLSSVESGASELALSLIGFSRSSESDTVLVHLLGLRLDGAGSEDLGCYFVRRGEQMRRRLARTTAAEIVSICRAEYAQLRKRELSDITDVSADDVCLSRVDVERKLAEMNRAETGNGTCD